MKDSYMKYFNFDAEIKAVFRSYFNAILKSIILITLLIIVSRLINQYFKLDQFWIDCLGIFGAACEAIALYGFVNIVSWDGNNPAEIWDHRLFKIFVFLGLACGALTYLLKAK